MIENKKVYEGNIYFYYFLLYHKKVFLNKEVFYLVLMDKGENIVETQKNSRARQDVGVSGSVQEAPSYEQTRHHL
jgi:hypothetical protein